jgi:flagellar motor component MotA
MKVVLLASGARQEGKEAEDLGKLLQSHSEELCSKGLVELKQHKLQDEDDDNKTKTHLKLVYSGNKTECNA